MLSDTDDERATCATCRHVLREDERATCHRCIGRARADLHAITNLHRALPAHLATITSTHPNPHRGPHAEAPIPGGDALVLLAAGSGATESLHRWVRAEATGRPHEEPPWGTDDRPGDPLSVAYELARWEDELRRHRRQPAADHPATVTSAAAYLASTLAWAGSHHPDFPELAADLAVLRHQLERATGTSTTPVTADAACFDCGGRLQREWTDTGLADDWTCDRCGRDYDHPAYLLAIRARLQQQAEGAA